MSLDNSASSDAFVLFPIPAKPNCSGWGRGPGRRREGQLFKQPEWALTALQVNSKKGSTLPHGSLLLPQTLRQITGSVPHRCTKCWVALCGAESQRSAVGCSHLHGQDPEQHPRPLLPEHHIMLLHAASQLPHLRENGFLYQLEGGVYGDGSCSSSQKHKDCAHTDSKISFTWSQLREGYERCHNWYKEEHGPPLSARGGCYIGSAEH